MPFFLIFRHRPNVTFYVRTNQLIQQLEYLLAKMKHKEKQHFVNGINV